MLSDLQTDLSKRGLKLKIYLCSSNIIFYNLEWNVKLSFDNFLNDIHRQIQICRWDPKARLLIPIHVDDTYEARYWLCNSTVSAYSLCNILKYFCVQSQATKMLTCSNFDFFSKEFPLTVWHFPSLCWSRLPVFLDAVRISIFYMERVPIWAPQPLNWVM